MSIRTKILEIVRQQYIRSQPNYSRSTFILVNAKSPSMLTRSELARFLATGPNYPVKHDSKASQFYINLNGSGTKAFLEYQKLGNIYDFVETFVPDTYRGKGIAKILAIAAFDYVVHEKSKIRISCTYLQQFYSENYDKYKNYVLDSDPDE